MTGEAVRFCPFGRQHRLEIACWAANSALNSILVSKLGDGQATMTLQDRGLFDALAYFKLLHIEGRITDQRLASFFEYFASPEWTQLIDLVILFEVSPSVAVDRDLAAKLNAGPGIITNIATLRSLSIAYEFVFEHLGNRFPRIHRLNTTNRESTIIVQEVIQAIQSMIEPS